MHLKSVLASLTLTWAAASWSHPGHPAVTAQHTHMSFGGDVLLALVAVAALFALRYRHVFRSGRTRKY